MTSKRKMNVDEINEFRNQFRGKSVKDLTAAMESAEVEVLSYTFKVDEPMSKQLNKFLFGFKGIFSKNNDIIQKGQLAFWMSDVIISLHKTTSRIKTGDVLEQTVLQGIHSLLSESHPYDLETANTIANLRALINDVTIELENLNTKYTHISEMLNLRIKADGLKKEIKLKNKLSTDCEPHEQKLYEDEISALTAEYEATMIGIKAKPKPKKAKAKVKEEEVK